MFKAPENIALPPQSSIRSQIILSTSVDNGYPVCNMYAVEANESEWHKQEMNMVNAIVALAIYATYRVRVVLTKSRAKRFRLYCECERALARQVK